ncbi:MAG: hypothetical protein Q8P27_00795 [Candidatus Peregrinibacteria bacterium]|nr:hypothetical protein [Candidatus Peregrinibacteria bacterium]
MGKSDLKDKGEKNLTDDETENSIEIGMGVPDLFGESSSPSQTASANSEMVNAVVSKGDKNKILGPKPKTSSGLDVRPNTFNLGGFIFKLSILTAILTAGFFYTQLSPTFELLGKNPVQTLSDLETSVQEEQTSINLYNFLIAKFALDDFSIAADTYLYKLSESESAYTSNNTKAELVGEMALLQQDMKDSLSTVQEKLNATLYPKDLAFTAESTTDLESEYESLLKTRIADEKQALRTEDDEESQTQVSNLDSALSLLNEGSFQRDLTALNLDEDLDAETIQTIFEGATSVSKDEFSTILNIKNVRVDWYSVLTELTSVTRKVDPLYASGISSNIDYTSLTFNSSDQTILLRGSTRTDDTLNFSLISDLIDSLESSTAFTEVSNRSFTKTEGDDDDYTANFRISLELHKGSDERDAVEVTTSNTSSDEEDRLSTEETDETTTEEDSDQRVSITPTTTEETEGDETTTEEVVDEELLDAAEETTTTDEETVEDTSEEETSVIEGAINFLDIFGAFVNQVPNKDETKNPESRIPRTP